MQNKIYLAGPCDNENRTLMMRVGKFLRESDFEVYCPFEFQVENAWDLTQERWATKVFEADKAAIDECDYFFMISLGRISSAGTNWEQGYAYALNKPVYVFQITSSPTSLMTYCGCTYFFNTTTERLLHTIDLAIKEGIYGWRARKEECHTILT